jgi:uncharacterized protein (TIGR03437 family)
VPIGSTRPPVVLLNGWEEGFTGSCPVATTSATTFGNLAQYLVTDGVPVVYLFDNCLEDPNQSIETLANDLGTYLNSIKYSDGTQVPQIDLVAHSMGGLIARAYLAGLQPNESYAAVTNTLVRDLVLIATPNFGSYVAGEYAAGIPTTTQSGELVPGSALLWNLSTWNQHGDDLRGANAIALVGNQGPYVASLSATTQLNNASDGLVSETSASLTFVSQKPSLTRVVPYCHIDPSAFTNTTLGSFNCNAPGIANVTDTSHLTGQIVRSFLAGATDWQSIGTAPTADPNLSTNGGWFFALQNSTGSYVSDMTGVEWGTVPLTDGGNFETIYYTDYVTGSGNFTVTSTSLGTINCGTLPAPVGSIASARCKRGASITSVTPLSATAPGRAVTAGTTLTLNGYNFGSQCSNCTVTATPAGSTTSTKLSITSWPANATAISVQLPANLTGLLTITVDAATGIDAIGVLAVSQSTIATDQTALQFSCTVGGTSPPAEPIQITNTGAVTLAWTATASQPWLIVGTASGTAPSTLLVSVSPAGLSTGTYTGTVQIAAAGSTNSPVSIAVTLTVVAPAAPPPSLVAAPQAITFNYTVGGAAPAAQNVAIGNGGGGTLSWTASGDAFWMALSPASGGVPASLAVTVNPANLAAGSYTATVTIAATDPTISPVSVVVTLVVQGSQAAGDITGITNAASYQPGFASATWVSIFGTNLSQLTYTWQAGDIVNGMLPTSLEGVSVTINGLPAYIDYISPTQINVLAPDDATVGPVAVQVTTAGAASNTVTVQKSAFSPAFLTLDGTHAAAQHLDYSLVGPPNLLAGVVTTPAQPGETIILYGVGFGPTNPPQPTGQTVANNPPLANPVQISIGGVSATVGFAGLAGSGLYQFNVTAPSLPNGDAAITASIGGVSAPTGVVVTVQQ